MLHLINLCFVYWLAGWLVGLASCRRFTCCPHCVGRVVAPHSNWAPDCTFLSWTCWTYSGICWHSHSNVRCAASHRHPDVLSRHRWHDHWPWQPICPAGARRIEWLAKILYYPYNITVILPCHRAWHRHACRSSRRGSRTWPHVRQWSRQIRWDSCIRSWRTAGTNAP